MNIAVVFAGGVGSRMRTRDVPKQFLSLHGKPILIHTLAQFERHSDIDAIVLACVGDWMGHCESLLTEYHISKVSGVVAGGRSGQESIYNALLEAERIGVPDDIVLIHDGVRPLVDADTIANCISSARERGSGVTAVPAKETMLVCDDHDEVRWIPSRPSVRIARAPQAFRLGEILAAHRRSIREGKLDYVDSASMMFDCGYDVSWVPGSERNLKITTPDDYFLMRAILDMKESAQLFEDGNV